MFDFDFYNKKISEITSPSTYGFYSNMWLLAWAETVTDSYLERSSIQYDTTDLNEILSINFDSFTENYGTNIYQYISKYDIHNNTMSVITSLLLREIERQIVAINSILSSKIASIKAPIEINGSASNLYYYLKSIIRHLSVVYPAYKLSGHNGQLTNLKISYTDSIKVLVKKWSHNFKHKTDFDLDIEVNIPYKQYIPNIYANDATIFSCCSIASNFNNLINVLEAQYNNNLLVVDSINPIELFSSGHICLNSAIKSLMYSFQEVSKYQTISSLVFKENISGYSNLLLGLGYIYNLFYYLEYDLVGMENNQIKYGSDSVKLLKR